MQLEFSELRDLLTTLDQTEIEELTLKAADFELTIRRRSALGGGELAPTALAVPPVSLPPAQTPAVALTPGVSPPAAPPQEASAASAPPPSSASSRLVDITSPMVGTFYRAPAPDEPPYVEVGDHVRVGQTVCILEAMKLMNELESEVSGTIVEILIENADPVEFGQVLMRVKPD
ncbi:acetyl-CoA carboxylase biotin carboxyl carrier protein [Trichothermofontia sichuanensis B231]|uniref:acetyl-CoA carboxylase biotin carboxyl carrier protein n=1 Tax=Trichothermofontia sichuanensis TaxID=3045816 RepID=UPI0022481450|nr:acetyl-CoA carboxylase biotin carboxyl carrier protein [Trichothermofontia sichuanensis]UZQ54497.1 acetyl-CoA carboxylase biotin carboxyl carrier protein [Trichothermofontia sichuanensis B231]